MCLYLDFGHIIIYDFIYNLFHFKLEMIKYNATLAITGAIQGMSREKITMKSFKPMKVFKPSTRTWFRKTYC